MICVEHFVILCVFMFVVPCCVVRYDLGIKRCSVRPYPQLFVGGLMFYLLYAQSKVTGNNRTHKAHERKNTTEKTGTHQKAGVKPGAWER
jgi:hypothetical protein